MKYQDQKSVGAEQQQGGPVPAPNKLPLPLPLAVRDNTSRFYKQSEVIAQVDKADTVIDSQKEIKPNVHQKVADADEAKVMRRDILANDKNGFKENTNQEEGGKVNSEMDTVRKTKLRDILSNNVSTDKLYDDGKNENHERQKRNALMEEFMNKDAFLVASILNKEENKQNLSNVMQEDISHKCEADEKINKINEVGTLNMAMLTKDKHNVADDYLEHVNVQEPLSVSDKHTASPHISDLGTVSYPEVKPDSPVEITESSSKGPVEHFPVSKANTSFTDTNTLENQKLEGIISSETEIQINSEDKAVSGQEDVSTLSSIIKTPSHLSEPKLNDAEMKLLNEAVIKAKDISVVAKPMTRDLKSVAVVQQVHEENEPKEKKDT